MAIIKIQSLNVMVERAQSIHTELPFLPWSNYCGQGFAVNQHHLNFTMMYDGHDLTLS